MKKVYFIIFTVFIIDIVANTSTNQEELIYLECKENKTTDPWIIIYEMYKPDKDNCKINSVCSDYNWTDYDKLRVVANKDYVHRTFNNQTFHESGFKLSSIADWCIPHNGILIDPSLEKRKDWCSDWKGYDYVTTDYKTYSRRSIIVRLDKITFTLATPNQCNGSYMSVDRTNLSSKRSYNFSHTGCQVMELKSDGQCNITSKDSFDNLYDEIFKYRKNTIKEITKKKLEEQEAVREKIIL